MHTVRLRHGEFKSQMPAGPGEEPDYSVKNISEIRKLPYIWSQAAKSHNGGAQTRRKQKN
jgi:hypothetical protein